MECRKIYILLFFSTFILNACHKEEPIPPNPDSYVKMEFDGKLIYLDDIHGEIYSQEFDSTYDAHKSFTFNGSWKDKNGNKNISITLIDYTPDFSSEFMDIKPYQHTYISYKSSSGSSAFNFKKEEVKISLSDLDEIEHTVSGTFSGSIQYVYSGGLIEIENGEFYNVPFSIL